MNTRKQRPFILLITPIFLFSTAFGQTKEQDKVKASATVLQEFGKMKESIPHELLQLSEGVMIIPHMINAGFVIGGKRGKGIAMVKDEKGNWSNPGFVTLTGGSLGFQAGVQAVDLVLVFKSRETLLDIGNGSFTLGGDISVAAGPVGRSSTANTDYKLEAEVYSYSRSKGLFAGISLSGSGIEIDQVANKAFYNKDLTAKEIFEGAGASTAAVRELKQTLVKLYQ